jgi:hypothetical protein
VVLKAKDPAVIDRQHFVHTVAKNKASVQYAYLCLRNGAVAAVEVARGVRERWGLGVGCRGHGEIIGVQAKTLWLAASLDGPLGFLRIMKGFAALLLCVTLF